jgi:hypothetical protein
MPQKSMATKTSERHYIQHNYHDHSQDIFSTREDYEVLMSSSQTSQCNYEAFCGIKTHVRKCGPAIKFPVKLHELLEHAEVDGFSDVVSWKIHGRAFSVNNSKDFSEKVMPLYFNQTKIRSFFRQLNLYGFQRITRGLDKGAYYHEYFLRGKPFLTSQILRQKIKGIKKKALPNPETEPDFYSMIYMGISSFSALTISASSTSVPDDFLLQMPSPTLKTCFSSHIYNREDNEENFATFSHLNHSKVSSSDDKESVDEEDFWLLEVKNKVIDEDDLGTLSCGSSLYENSVSDLFDGADLCSLLPEPGIPFELLYSKSDTLIKSEWGVEEISVINDQFDDSVQHYSLYECNILCSLLQDKT